VWNLVSLTLREEHRLRVFESRCWGEYLDISGRLHNEELHNLCASPSIITVIE
jgi:hypothetical protein